MLKRFKKIITVCLVLILVSSGILQSQKTFAFFNDKEVSPGNTMQAAVLDFSVTALDNFENTLLPTQGDNRSISMQNNGTLGFQYIVQANNFNGALCGYLDIEAKLDGETKYSGNLTTFYYDAGDFVAPEDWQFIVSLKGNDSNYQSMSCDFDLNFSTKQGPCFGFSDTETISNTVNSGIWGNGGGNGGDNPGAVVINEVYYDVLENEHCSEAKSEWIELYNNSDSPVNIKDWQLCHGGGCNTINPNISIPAYGFAVISHDAATWQNCFELAPGAELVHSLGGEWVNLGDDSGYVILKNASDVELDCVDWGGNGTCSFIDGSVSDISDGHSIARITKGVDNDLSSDWEDLDTPNPGTNPHSCFITTQATTSVEQSEPVENNAPQELDLPKEEKEIPEESEENIEINNNQENEI